MIFIILSCGMICVLISALIRDLSETVRGLVCWTISVLAQAISAVVYFASANTVTINSRALISTAAALAGIVAIILLIELIAPAKRLRRRGRYEYDSLEAERSLNIVFVIIVSALTVFAAALEVSTAEELTSICLIPAAAVSARQLSYYLYRARTDTSRELSEKQLRENAVRSLKIGKRRL